MLYRTDIGTSFGVVPQGELTRLSMPLGVGTWRRVSIALANAPSDGGADGVAYVELDGANVGQVPLPAAFQTRGIKPRVLVGAQGNGPAGAFHVNVDDVRLYYGD